LRARQAFSSSVGSKILIALTGLVLLGFLVFHLAGNLLVFAGPAAYNAHAHALITNPLVVPAELGLLAVFLIHVYRTIRGAVANRGARPTRYATTTWAGGVSRKTIASTSMIASGLVILAFVVLHLATFKYGAYYASTVPGERDLYRLMVEVFQRPGYVVFYVVAMAVVGLHLRHGISSTVQSLGLMPPSWIVTVLRTGAVVAVVIAVLFLIIPIWIYVAL
jgi:succinate dehydrogenase / fumarate reductase cytochrome b subunit